MRELEAVAALADAAGFGPPMIETMPANNVSIVFRGERQAMAPLIGR